MKALFHHVIDVVIDENGRYYPKRFTDKQIEALGNLNEAFAVTGRCSTGMALKCYTAADTVSFAYCVANQGSVGGFDVYENGVLYHNELLPLEGRDSAVFTYTKETPGEVLLEIVFPSYAEMHLWDMNFGDWRPYDASNDKLVLWYGDSITQATAVSTPSLTFPSLASRLCGMDYINRGIGSLYYDESFLDENDPADPDFIMVEFGANDLVMHGPDKKLVYINDAVQFCSKDDVPMLMETARAFLEKLKRIYPKAKIYVMSMLWACQDWSELRIEANKAYHPALEKLVNELGLNFIPGLDLMPHLKMVVIDDRIHLSTIGCMAAAQSLAKYLRG